MTLSPLLKPKSFDDLPGWRADRHGEAFAAFRLSARRALQKPYKSGSLGIDAGAFEEAFHAADRAETLDDEAARGFFERWFLPCRVIPEGDGFGFVTGFYEPEVAASPVRTDEFTVPLLGVPDDLVKVDDANRPDGLDPYLAFGRSTSAGIVEYFDRPEIEKGALGERASALAWLADPVDAFFVHVQGAVRLSMPDGSVKRVTYAAKSGQRFTGPGGLLVAMGEIPGAEISMQAIRAWFRRNPHRVDEILHQNRSYIFFRFAEVEDTGMGPIAAAKVPLTAGRSMAVDRLLHTFATPFFVDAPALRAFDDFPFRRLMIAQDTGSAIVGAARGDLFAGSGYAAGEIAGVVRHPADFYALVPRALLEAGPA
ncbi:murein transglycosylase A [Neoaquamicrobium sediminum]|uniref:murein transglycosylase A n=1 Tax=Neoaquamicrobium sediminum TaxID=1849104 RepID=UPI001563DECC|nr:MltA domain-containing protein [Mesorhizobium sediminum]NRC53686.1 murein transglycosylase A [Mesorhizobium sediminum]